MTPKSEKIGKICTFFFTHLSFCVVNFAKQGDFTTITAPPSQGSKRKREQASSPKIAPPITQNPLRTKWGGENKRTILF